MLPPSALQNGSNYHMFKAALPPHTVSSLAILPPVSSSSLSISASFYSSAVTVPRICSSQEGIDPMWEDGNNVAGGKWVVQFPKGKREVVDEYWLHTLLAVMGEVLHPSQYHHQRVSGYSPDSGHACMYTHIISKHSADSAPIRSIQAFDDFEEVNGCVVSVRKNQASVTHPHMPSPAMLPLEQAVSVDENGVGRGVGRVGLGSSDIVLHSMRSMNGSRSGDRERACKSALT